MKSSNKNVSGPVLDPKDVELGSLSYGSPVTSSQTQTKSSSVAVHTDSSYVKISSFSSILIKSLSIFKILVAIVFVLVFIGMRLNLAYGILQCLELLLYIGCICLKRWKRLLTLRIISHTLKFVTVAEIGFWVYFFCRGISVLGKFSMGLPDAVETDDRNKFFILAGVVSTITVIMPLAMSIVVHFILKKRERKE